ncbi:hypothetical protein [Phytohabitans houttuyneae]|uniref:Uncharacterized protein n=1 Tax=Phytohabitans houttuyneae TaxID=1076126 RepID=A0A6V8KII1_9ACTN|nr:hypothetical protein [Phytohabitans houttuyneae]GFJ85012.1 hypothetical protein Phou_091920 [Phytohabitans houttuyneae]
MPESETDKISISTKDMKLSKTSVTGKAGLRLGTSALLATIFPFLDARANVEGTRGKERSTQEERGDVIELRPIKTPHRQLIQLALHYSANLPDRVCSIGADDYGPVLDAAYVTQLPRALVFFEVPAGLPIIPLAVEHANGKVVTLFDELAGGISKTVRTLPPTYPAEDDSNATREYWKWYSNNYKPIVAMNVLESGIGEGGLPRWVDYRLPMTEHESLHLSVRGRGRYETGIYAYSTVLRGHEHGLRVVGTLKRGPGLNILAIFEN